MAQGTVVYSDLLRQAFMLCVGPDRHVLFTRRSGVAVQLGEVLVGDLSVQGPRVLATVHGFCSVIACSGVLSASEAREKWNAIAELPVEKSIAPLDDSTV